MNITQQLWTAKEWARVKSTGSETIELIHNATNEDKWGPTGQQMEEICRAFPRKGQEIMEELRWRMKNRDKAWRACYKSLLVLDYLARNAAEQFLPEICSVVPMLRTISASFYYTNPKGVDHGISVRERSKNLAELMSDGLLLREEREKAAQTKAKLAHNASDGGGGPSRYGGSAYGNYSSQSAYGGRPAGGGGANRYAGQGGGGAGSRQAYDPYRRTAAPEPAVPRSKEEQERYDMEMALRMQREEERRAGVSAEQLEAMYARKVEQKKAQDTRQQNAASADEDLARRLQEEEETRARREGKALPQLRSDMPPAPTAAVATPQAPAQAPAPPKQPETNALDDLFAPAPAAPAGQAPASAGDPFDAFLTNKTQQQDQWAQPQQASNPWGQPQQQQQQAPADPWSQQQQQQPSNPWGQPQQPQPPQQASNPWGQPQAPPQSQPQSDPWQQSSAAPQQAQWDAVQKPQQPPQQQQPSADPWGQPQQSDPWGAPQQAPQQQQQQQPVQNQWSQPPQQAPTQYHSDPWAQPQQPQQQQQQYQQPSADPWGQPQQAQQAPADPWGAPSQPPPTQASNQNQATGGASSGQGDAAFANMWASLNKFDTQKR